MCFQEVSVAWAKEIIDNCLDSDWRGHVDNKCFMAWKVGSVERLDYEWVMLFPRDESHTKIGVATRKCVWDSSVGRLRRQSSGTGPARKADVRVEAIVFHIERLPTCD